MDLTVLSYTHTDYQDIWPLMIDGLEKLELPCEKVLGCNVNPESTSIDAVFHRVITYDDSYPYPHRQFFLWALRRVLRPRRRRRRELVLPGSDPSGLLGET